MESLNLLVKEELEAVSKQIAEISVESDIINNALKCFLNSPSKKVRTLMTSLYIKAHNKSISDKSLTIMTVGEIIHNASLLHDDVIDNADSRRGKTTLAKELSPHISVLLGDYLLAFATKKLISVNNNEIINIFLECTKAMCEAEINQFLLRGKQPSLEDYLKISRGKTAKLFEAILAGCAIIENLEISTAEDFAKNFGILFQLKNDLEAKSAANDKKNGIYTLKDILGIEKSKDLIDNYQGVNRGVKYGVINCLKDLPDNIYKKGLEDLIYKL